MHNRGKKTQLPTHYVRAVTAIPWNHDILGFHTISPCLDGFMTFTNLFRMCARYKNKQTNKQDVKGWCNGYSPNRLQSIQGSSISQCRTKPTCLEVDALIQMPFKPLVCVWYLELKVPDLRGTPHPGPTAGGSCCHLKVRHWPLLCLLWQFFSPVSASSDSPPSSAQSSAHQILSRSIWNNIQTVGHIVSTLYYEPR